MSVDDFAATNTLLGRWASRRSPIRNPSASASFLDGAQLEIDTWPQIPTYLEIEAGSKDEVIRVAGLLGYTEADLTGGNIIKIYARYGLDLNTIRALRF
ncbi:hypothetical protein [Amycolatopsis palatopharyngis]|uniref:hypothetical protein n=1 Tax=Amycolatopsis palatopharyngis TaxID=187982 RepID=UPI001FECCB44|nr:hypothetical protein [Amycolatopsis palatopharyngis]